MKMNITIKCNCHHHMLEVDPDEGYCRLVFWNAYRGDWMGFWTRLKKAWEVLTKGSTVLDDFYIAGFAEAFTVADELRNWGIREKHRQIEESLMYEKTSHKPECI